MKGLKFDWDESKTVARNARSEVTMACSRYFKSGRDTFRSRPSPAELHAFRLQTKRFRYTLELFRPVYGPTLEQLIRSLRGLQQLLGDINDCQASRKLIVDSPDRRALAARRVLRMLGRWQAEKTSELGRLWLEFDHEGSSRRWINYLAVYPGRVQRKA